MQIGNSRWFLPVFAVALGVAMLAAMWVGGDPGTGLFSLGFMVAFGALILLVDKAKRSAACAATAATSASVRSTL